MRRAKKATAKRNYSPPKLMDTEQLCKDLVITAAFVENKHVADKLYKAVRQLQLLDKVARQAGLLRT